MTAQEIFPDSHETDYAVSTNRQYGERALGRIAASSTREYLWTFAADEEVWKNHRVHHFEHRVYRKEVLQGHRLGVTVPDRLLSPMSPEVSIYHNHPSAPSSFEHGEIKTQLPSSEDLGTCARLSINGYQDFRIATALGITTLTLDTSVAAKGSMHIKGFDVKPMQMRGWEENFGIIGAIHEAVNFFNEKLDGQIQISFAPFLDTSPEQM